MITLERLQELIDFHENNLGSMKNIAQMFGGANNPMIEMTQRVATELTKDTIQALKEYANMSEMKNLVDGG